MAMNPNYTAPLAPPAAPMPTGTEPTPGDESAMAAGLAAGPMAGPVHHAKMTKPAHSMSGGAKRAQAEAAMSPVGPA